MQVTMVAAASLNHLSDVVRQIGLEPAQPRDSLNVLRVHPAQILPFDVLSQIFTDCVPASHKGGDFPTTSAKREPLLLGRVCSHWRRVALATHLLWAKLNIVYRYHRIAQRSPRNSFKPAVAEWANRAGQCALSYHISAESYSIPEDENLVTEVVDAIIPHRERWRHISGILPLAQWTAICSAIANGAPLLERLHISGYIGSNERIDIELLTTPLLETLVLKVNHRVLGLDACQQSLRNLSVCGTDPIDCMSYLLHCPNLEVFSLKNEKIYRDVTYWHAGIVKTMRLVSLELDAIFAGHILDCLHSPLLKTLQFSSLRSGQQLKSCLDRSKPPLTSLDATAWINLADLFDSLRYVPGLKVLRIREKPEMWSQQVERLKLGPRINENICPGLKLMEFDGCIGGDMKYLEDVVLSRWKGRTDVATIPSSTTGSKSALDGGWERNLSHVIINDWMSDQGSLSRFTERPMIQKFTAEGLHVFEDDPFDSDYSV
ncbi:hypothetical protein BD410DRAFT_635206 [Rickenella mellea]|uniref:Uncharacterized protein n=1 Tax=Rickenella mellea TaxID=50990 RepID=A0A4Y7QDZ4_9AGAM|nr:hypothetical protein BD410DRAFT_635206 [Rickenella mellea]